jgi:hypothetical protein
MFGHSTGSTFCAPTLDNYSTNISRVEFAEFIAKLRMHANELYASAGPAVAQTKVWGDGPASTLARCTIDLDGQQQLVWRTILLACRFRWELSIGTSKLTRAHSTSQVRSTYRKKVASYLLS